MNSRLEAEKQLEEVGFIKLGITPLYVINDFTVSSRDDGIYQFYSDYPTSLIGRKLDGLRGIRTGALVYSGTPCLIFVGIDQKGDEYAVGIETSGSGGGMSGENIPKVHDFAGKSFRQQLIETGFTPMDEEVGVYHTRFKKYGDREIDIYAFIKNDCIDKILCTAELSSKGEKGRSFVERFGVILEEVSVAGAESVIRAKNSVFEFEYNRSGNISVNNILRDLAPEELGITTQEKLEQTGFCIGGVNSTTLIRNLTSINGQSIQALEQRMRPEFLSERGISVAGFLGENESLLEVMARDNDFVLSQGLTHQSLGRMIRYVQALNRQLGIFEFSYKGRRFRYEVTQSKGLQESPFSDGTATSIDIEVNNLNNGKSFNCSGLLGEMIERYGFYEGPASPYRLDPYAVIDTFDFLKK